MCEYTCVINIQEKIKLLRRLLFSVWCSQRRRRILYERELINWWQHFNCFLCHTLSPIEFWLESLTLFSTKNPIWLRKFRQCVALFACLAFGFSIKWIYISFTASVTSWNYLTTSSTSPVLRHIDTSTLTSTNEAKNGNNLINFLTAKEIFSIECSSKKFRCQYLMCSIFLYDNLFSSNNFKLLQNKSLTWDAKSFPWKICI